MLGHAARLLLLAATLLSAVPAVAAPPAPEGPLGPPRRALVAKLEALATWCDGNRLPGERDRIFRRILTLAPDHPRARAGLRYTRAGKTSPWVQSSEYVEPSDWNKGLLDEAKKRRIEAAQAFRAAAAEALSAAGVAEGDGRRDEAVELSIDLAPEDAQLRKARGDTEVDGAWVLPETVEGKRRRAEFRKVVAGANLDSVKSDPRALASHWKAGAVSKHFVSWGYVSQEECLEEVRLRELGLTFLREVLGPVDEPAVPRRAVLFEDYKQGRRFLQSDPAYAAVLKTSELVGALSLPDGTYATWQEDESRRTVSALRILISVHLRERFDTSLRAWAMEGVGQRICRHVARRHGASFASVTGTDRPDAGDDDDSAPLDLEAKWLPLAAAALDRDPVGKVRAVLTMSLNAMRRGDVLVSYALGAYLLEGRPESLAPLVKASATIEDADRACKEALGVDAATLAWRVRRWVLEAGAN